LLWNTLSEAKAQGTYKIKVEGDKRRQINKRQATIEIRYIQTSVKRSSSALGNKVAQTPIYAVEAKEINGNQSNPIEWRLITTYPVACFEDACLIVEWYSCRWLIEQIFRLLKHKGFNIPPRPCLCSKPCSKAGHGR
jgi:hypothetical protein